MGNADWLISPLPGNPCAFCLEGDIRLGPEEQEVDLQPGDAICFAADLPHTYTSINGAKALLVMQYPPAQGILLS